MLGIVAAQRHDYIGFYTMELKRRKRHLTRRLQK